MSYHWDTCLVSNLLRCMLVQWSFAIYHRSCIWILTDPRYIQGISSILPTKFNTYILMLYLISDSNVYLGNMMFPYNCMHHEKNQKLHHELSGKPSFWGCSYNYMRLHYWEILDSVYYINWCHNTFHWYIELPGNSKCVCKACYAKCRTIFSNLQIVI